MRRYKAVSQKLADDFKSELRDAIGMALANPGRFHPVKPGFHRANLKRFPYHFIYCEIPEGFPNEQAAPLLKLIDSSPYFRDSAFAIPIVKAGSG